MLIIILQIILVAVPQAALFIIFSLLLTNHFDLINIDEFSGKIELNIKGLFKLAFPAIILSVFSIVSRRLRFEVSLAPLVIIFITFLSIIMVYKINRFTDAIKLFLSIVMGVAIGGVIEVIYVPIILNSKGISIYEVFDSLFINFMTSIPTIIIFLIINTVLITKKKNFLNISVLKSIAQSWSLMAITLFVFLVNLLLILLYSRVFNDKVLAVYSVKAQISISVIIMVFPALNLGGLWFLIYSVKFKEALDKRMERDKMIQEISVTRERNRMARDMHDTLVHSLTLIIKLLEVSKISSKTNPAKIDDQLEDAIRIAQDGIKKVKRSVSGILMEKLLTNDLVSSLNQLACDFQNKAGVIVKVLTSGVEDDLSKEYAVGLYIICQEALTNSLRHEKAKNIAIVLRFESRYIELSIFDDGKGCKEINKVFGLNGMEQRISELNGKINYKSSMGQGFIINIEVLKQEINRN